MFANDRTVPSAWSSRLGFPVALVDVHCNPVDVANPYWLRGYTEGTYQAMCLTTHLVEGTSAAEYRAAGQLMAGAGFAGPRAYLRTGNECNLDESPSALTSANRPDWINRFTMAADAFRAGAGAGSHVVFCLNEGRHQTQISNDELDAVAHTLLTSGTADVLGIDFYDQWEPVRTEDQWIARVDPNRYGSIGWWYTFAVARGARFALPEWGVSSGTQWAGHAGGDNPFFVRKIINWLSERRDHVAYDSYFEEPAGYVDSSLLNGHNPLASAAYFSALAGLHQLARSSERTQS